ncbi:MATE family efflux transporter [Bacteroides salyersiae]|uniref:MATE family efflux transporter n=1 Tax=Bacteroides salyersiae TaxID=291644 RepID=UPI00189B4C7D|nr:MATE family efflux transporter [Bacteroides salyersiae]
MKELNLTQGSVPKVLLQFAVPFLVANILQALYGGADLFVVGQYDDSAGVAAVAIGSQVMQTITGIILGITTGTTVLIAIATSAKDNRKVASTIGSSIWLFSITGIILTLLMILLHSQIAEWMHTPTEAMSDTKSYILVCSAGILFIIGYNVVCGILRGLGDSKTPLYFIALACIINIVLDFILVGYFHLGATGAAIATVTAQGVSFATALCFLHRKGFHFEFTRRDIRLNGVLSKRILALGAPIALQDALINVSFLIITVIVNQMGVIASASLGVVEKIIVFAMLPPMAISSAVATMTAQNYGAGLIRRMNQCLLSGIGLALIFGVTVCLYSQFLPETLTAFFSKDPAVISMAAEYLKGYSIDCVIVSFVFCINSYFSGQGNSLFPMIHSLIATFLFRIPLSYWFSQIDSSSLFIMGFAPPLSTIVSLLICIWYLRYTKDKRSTTHPCYSQPS